MKSYTDINQSKKLTEILPMESADMYYPWDIDSKSFLNIPIVKDDSYYLQCSIDCWSLAALLSVLPRFIKFKGNKYYLIFMKEYVEYANDEISITGRCLHTTGNDNLVDACVEMIIKLHEQKLL